MTTRKKLGGAHRFGGDWTSRKLEVLAGYLSSYVQALKDKPSSTKPFRKAYIDAFAGSGAIEHLSDDAQTDAQVQLLPEIGRDESRQLLSGSARIALQTKPSFDKYIFIEQDAEHCAQLETLKTEFPELAPCIDVRRGEANEQIRAICARNWRSSRAVLFLDPYGMQVEWSTIEAVARTRAIDLWLLFPLGIGVNRLLTNSGEIPPSWARRLDLLLGTSEWRDAFYTIVRETNLFGDEDERVVKASIETIGAYFNERLRAVFAGVVDKPGVLRNSTNNPLYLLCFAVGNERGRGIALRLANHHLKKLL